MMRDGRYLVRNFNRGGASLVALSAALTGTILVAPVAAGAQAIAPATSAEEGEIIVTARRREERLSDVPAALRVLTGEALNETAIARLDELQNITPGLKIAGQNVAIRGVSNNVGGVGGGPSTAVHLDGIYLPRPYFILSQMFDVDRVEVLKGPQGTLYGRNATAGAINIVSRDPGRDFGADGYIGYGTNDLVRAEGAMNLPFENGGIRVSGAYTRDDGYTKNIGTGGGRVDAQNYKGVRVRGVYNFTPSLKGLVTLSYVDDRSNVGQAGSNNPLEPNVFAAIGPQRESVRRVNFDIPSLRRQRVFLFSGTLEADLGGVIVKSITGYIWNKLTSQGDSDGAGAFIEQESGTAPSRYLSQEFNISGGSATGLSWTAGAYAAREKTASNSLLIDNDNPPVVDPYVYFQRLTADTAHAYAVFGEASYAFSPQLTATVGARYTKQNIRGTTSGTSLGTPFASSARADDDGFTPKFLIQYKPHEGNLFYASATRGIKGGGLNYSSPVASYKPEKLWAYEIGTKNVLLDGAVNFDLNGFYYKYTDLQLRTAVFPPGQGVQIRVSNVAKASIWGAEAAVALHPTKALTLEANAAYLHTELKDFISPSSLTDLSGLPLPLSPKWTITTAAEYRVDLTSAGAVTARAEYNYVSSVIFPALADPVRERTPGYGLLNGSLRYDLPGDRIYVAVIGRNLTGKTYLINRFYFAGFSDIQTYGAPRMVEARVGFKF